MGSTFCASCGAFALDGQKTCVQCGAELNGGELVRSVASAFALAGGRDGGEGSAFSPAASGSHPALRPYAPLPSAAPSLKDPPYPWEGRRSRRKQDDKPVGVWGYFVTLAVAWVALLTPLIIFGLSISAYWDAPGLWLGLGPVLCAVLLLVWALGGSGRRARRSMARAALVLLIILSIVCVAGYFILFNMAQRFWAEQPLPGQWREGERPVEYRPLPGVTALDLDGWQENADL